MSRSTEGEFELVLGNKQLLSLFFLVVVLFAVFFSLGYMVGKSVAPVAAQTAQPSFPAASPSNAAPLPSPVPETAPPRPGDSRELPSAAGAEQPPVPVTETQPARTEPPTATPEKSAPPPAPETQPVPQHSPAQVARELHLQLAAVRVRQDAEVLAASVRKKGYKAMLHSDTRDGWYRVLVGPFPNERAALEVKAQLEKDGYKSILKKP